MDNDKIAVIGDRDSVLAFKAAGVEVFCPQEHQEIEQTLKTLAKQNYAIIFITENKAQQIIDLIDEYKENPYPVILTIPSSGGSSGLGMNRLKSNVEKAIGMDIVFNKEDDK